MQRVSFFVLIAALFIGPLNTASAVSINEIRTDQFLSDDDEYFELEGSPGESLDDLFYIVIGDDPVNGSGVIESVVSLDGREIADDGFFLATESSFGASGTAFAGIESELTTLLNFENSDNVTHLLVSNFTGQNLQDLDASPEDGTLDSMPWGAVLDAVGIVESPDLSAPGSEWYYGLALGGVDMGPVGSFAPGHIYRQNNGGGPFVIGEFSLDTSDPNITIDDTPGSSNVLDNMDPDGDFDGDGFYNCSDIDTLVAAVASGSNNPLYDINGDNFVNQADIDAWLLEAGTELEITIAPGDANLDGIVNGVDFAIWSANKFAVAPAWCSGDFNADGSIDGFDFLIWNQFKAVSSAAVSVPEPTVMSLLVCGVFAIGRLRRTRN